MRTRSRVPPMLTRGIIRSVWFAKAAPSAGAGAAVQVPTQCEVSIGMRLLGGGLYSLTLRCPLSCCGMEWIVVPVVGLIALACLIVRGMLLRLAFRREMR